MENAQLISLSRQIALERLIDVAANNIANLNTTGFKAEKVLFEEYLMPVARDRDFAWPDQPLSFTNDWGTMHDMRNGETAMTGNPLDVALLGDGFLTVMTPEGERWTRGGSLQINAKGILVDLNGYPVIADGSEVQFDQEETDITIAADGTISTGAGAKGRLQMVEFANTQELTREGRGLFAGGTPIPATGTEVLQGSVERSNVSGITEMSEMIRVSRSYQSLASLMQRQDEIRRAAIQRLGDATA
ncbi:MAG: flagellar basal-body rod protein FlgF [Devosia sp.]